ncbi:hypothetical protein ACGFIK_25925 [Micromonospora sp. NPDC048871]|uniref:hypothetical protein n=1 Tax=unclassified Micromonospora TaxID=2617518 RepID=UPI002E165899|nr:hypothetical protein OIE53_06765 [Micromonospora sp. NBC_01739]
MTEKSASKSLLSNRLFWAGIVVALVGLVFNLGWFFVPLSVWLDDPGFVPMPEVLLGWWVIAIGVVMMIWSLRRRLSR